MIGTPLFQDNDFLQLPKYEIKLLGYKNETIFVSSLLVKDELELLSTINLTEHKIFQTINKLIFNKIALEDKQRLWNNDYNEFIKQSTLADRDAIILGILLSTYDDKYELDASCTNCGSKNRVFVDLHKSVQIKPYNIPDPIDKATNMSFTAKIEKPYLTEITFKVPSLKRYEDMLRYVDNRFKPQSNEKNGFMILMFPILLTLQNIKVYQNDATMFEFDMSSVGEYTFDDGVSFLETMPRTIIKIIFNELKKLAEEDIGVKVEHKYKCSSCDYENTIIMQPVDFLFQLL